MPIFIFILLLLPLCACTAENPETASNADTIEKAVGDAGSEESSFGSSEAISPGNSETAQSTPAGMSDKSNVGTATTVQSDQTTQVSGEDVVEPKKVGTYTMIKGEDAILIGERDSFCTEFLKNLKEFEHEDFMSCGMKFSSKYPEYRNLEWVMIDVKKDKGRLETFILGGFSGMPGESAKMSALNRTMVSLLSGTTVAMEASIEGIFKYRTDLADGPKIKIGFFPDQKNKILKISRSDCLEGDAPYAFLLDAKGQDFEEYAYTFSPNKNGEGIHASGNFFFYKDRLMNVHTEFFPSTNNPWNADGHFVVGDVVGMKHFDAEGNVMQGSVVDRRQCEYIWNQDKE